MVLVLFVITAHTRRMMLHYKLVTLIIFPFLQKHFCEFRQRLHHEWRFEWFWLPCFLLSPTVCLHFYSWMISLYIDSKILVWIRSYVFISVKHFVFSIIVLSTSLKSLRVFIKQFDNVVQMLDFNPSRSHWNHNIWGSCNLQ